MVKFKILCDEHIPAGLREALKSKGKRLLEVKDVEDFGLKEAEDKEIFDFARKKNFTILTQNIRDFYQLLNSISPREFEKLRKPLFIFLKGSFKKEKKEQYGKIAREIVKKLNKDYEYVI